MQKISAILITLNEAKNISRCLKSLRQIKAIEDIVVCDSFSSDGTVEIARQFPQVEIVPLKWTGFVENKNAAISRTKNAWVFWIDADEEVDSELAAAIDAWASGKLAGEVSAMAVTRKTFFMGRWIAHSGWYPDRVIRLFHKDRAGLSPRELHEGVEIRSGRAGALKGHLLHHSYTSLLQYFGKMNRYGEAGARQLLKEGRRFRFSDLLFRPWLKFSRYYFLRCGFLDGVPGFIVCVGSAFSTFIKYANVYYLASIGTVESPITELKSNER